MRVCAIDYDPQENFWDLAVYGKVFKKIFRERARPGDGRSDLQPAVGSWKSGFCWDTGLITPRLRLVIMVILGVFRMGWGCAESVWVELGRYGTLASTNHDILAQE